MWVGSQSPSAGARVPAGTTVALKLNPGPIGSIGVPEPMRQYRIPNFVGGSLADAVKWLSHTQVEWHAQMPPLTSSDAPSLFAAYGVTAQRPKPGTTLQLGVLRYGAFHLTPVTFQLLAKPHS
jgi:beta-lactam-binding protein with PASTA domain